ncbi:MAG: site-2 protease family protein [bacterium]
MLTIAIVFIILLGAVIFVHELGHFITAKKMGAKVEEFGFGFPPRIFGIKRGETTYSLNWIPIGGFVKILGEDGDKAEDPRSFGSKKPWQRALMATAGVMMNFLFAAILLMTVAKIGIPEMINDENKDIARDQKIQIVSVAEGSIVEDKIKIGDILQSIDDKGFEEVNAIGDYTSEKKGETVKVKVTRGDTIVEEEYSIPEEIEEGKGALGIGLVKTGLVKYPWYKAIGIGISATFSITVLTVSAFFTIVKDLIFSHHLSGDVAGPVGIAVMTGQVYEMGLVYLLQFAAVLSINLGIINILPLPALDGGRLLFIIIEKIRGKKVSARAEGMIHTIGFFALITLVLVITFWDVIRSKEILINFWNNIFG